MFNFIPNEQNENEYQCESTQICDDKIQNKKRDINKKLTKNTLQRKRQKKLVDSRNKSFDDFRITIVDPPQKLDSEESNIIYGYLRISSEIISNKLYIQDDI